MPHNRRRAKEQGYCQKNGLWIDPEIDNLDVTGHIKDYSVSSCWMQYSTYITKYAPYKPGDTLYIREAWAFIPCIGCNGDYIRAGAPMNCYDYQAVEYDDGDSISDGCFIYRADCRNPERIVWRPSIHMPKQAARIWLKVVDVRVEKLQEITIDGCEEEGCWSGHNGDIFAFMASWDSTIKKADRDRYGWNVNHWVWVIEFERCERPKEDR